MAAMDHVSWRGVTLTARQRDAFRWAEKKFQKKFPGVSLMPTQGSFAPGYGPSAGTHDGAGACDFRVNHLTREQRVYMVRCLKDAGQAAWHRTEAQGFSSEHVHTLDKVTTSMASLARWQVAQFDKGRNGLSGNGPDNSYRPSPAVKWSWAKQMPVAA